MAKYNLTNGDTYEGDLDQNNQPHGYGKYTWANGNYYVGDFQHGNKHGKGHYVSAGGSYYIGEFAYDFFHGYGKKVYKSGIIYEGEWKSNQPCGHGTLIDKNSKFEGTWSDEYNATNITKYSGGKTTKGIIKDNVFIPTEYTHANKGSTAGPLSGHTTLKQQIIDTVLKYVQENPITTDAKIKNFEMKDPRWPADDGWVKVEQVVEVRAFEPTSKENPSGENLYRVKVHYNANRYTREVDDFKVKEITKNGKSEAILE